MTKHLYRLIAGLLAATAIAGLVTTAALRSTTTATTAVDAANTDPVVDGVEPPTDIPAWVDDPVARAQAEAAMLPATRPKPTEADVVALLGRRPDIDALAAAAAKQHAVGLGTDVTVGSLDGILQVDYVWGDVENYQSGQELFGRDAIVIRLARRVGVGVSRMFYVSSFDAETADLRLHYATEGESDVFGMVIAPQA